MTQAIKRKLQQMIIFWQHPSCFNTYWENVFCLKLSSEIYQSIIKVFQKKIRKYSQLYQAFTQHFLCMSKIS